MVKHGRIVIHNGVRVDELIELFYTLSCPDGLSFKKAVVVPVGVYFTVKLFFVESSK